MTETGAVEATARDPHSPAIEIVINGTPHEVHDRKLSYKQVVDLAYDGNPPTGPSMMIVVTYSRGEGSQKGMLVAGQEVSVHKGMVFNVYDAAES